MEPSEMMKVAGRYWSTLGKLDERDYYMSELAGELKKSKPEVFKFLQELEKVGLVSSYWDGRRKYFHLDEKGKKIWTFVNDLYEQPEEAILPQPEPWRVAPCLKALDSSIGNEHIQHRLADAFVEICRNYRVWDDPAVVDTFGKVIHKPEMFPGKVGERFRTGLKLALHHMLQDGESLRQVMEDWYDSILKNARNPELNDELRAFFISLLNTVFQFNPKKRDEIAKVAYETCFERTVEIKSKAYEKAKDILQRALRSDQRPLREKMFNKLIGETGTGGASRNEKAEDIISPFITALTQKSREQVKDFTGSVV